MSFDAHTLRDALRTDLMSAMKSRDTDAVAALRTAIAAIDNAESVDTTGLTDTEVPRRVLTATDVRDILAGHVRDYLADADGTTPWLNGLRRNNCADRPTWLVVTCTRTQHNSSPWQLLRR